MITDEEARQTIASNIRDALEAQQLTQSDLARLCGDHIMTINKIVRGKSLPRAGVLARIADALGLSIDAILSPRQSRSKKIARAS